jgi:type II secretory pathway component PulF
MQSLGLVNHIALLAIAILMFLALTILDSHRSSLLGPRNSSRNDDIIRIALGVIAGLLTIHGIIGAITMIAGPIALPVGVLAFFLGVLAIRQYYRTERQAVMPYVAVAVERGIPLATAIRAYALERADYFGRQSVKLAELLEQGARLPSALRLSGHRLGIGSVLAVGIGDDFQCLAATLRQSMRDEQRLRQVVRNIGERLGYMTWLLAMTLGVHGFFSLKIAPVLFSISEDFGSPVNPSIRFLALESNGSGQLAASHLVWAAGLLVGFILVVFMAAASLLMLGELWWRWLPLADMFSIGHDRSWILRALGWGIDQGRSVSETLASIARHLPSGRLQRRVQRALDAVESGAPWTTSLRSQRLIGTTDEVLLIAAEEAGNLAWACEQRADSRLRQQEYRWQRVISIAFPAVIILAALDVLLLTSSTFSFLVDVVENLL